MSKDLSDSSKVIFELRGISKNFGGIKALNEVSLEIRHGERHAIIGPNGAGKTTLFNVISGELFPDEGEVRLFNQVLDKTPTRKRIHMGLGRTYQITNLFPELTVEENLFLAVKGTERRSLRVFKSWNKEKEKCDRAFEIARQVGVEKLFKTPIKELSYGDQRKLDLSLAIAGKPKLLLLDEPMAGLSRSDRPQIARLVSHLDPDITVIIIEHDIETAFSIVQNVTVLHMGSVIVQGRPEEIRNNEIVKKIYMGV